MRTRDEYVRRKCFYRCPTSAFPIDRFESGIEKVRRNQDWVCCSLLKPGVPSTGTIGPSLFTSRMTNNTVHTNCEAFGIPAEIAKVMKNSVRIGDGYS